MAVLVRLLKPEDYGLMAIVTVILGFASLFSDMGLNAAYLQQRTITPKQRSSLFWSNIAISGIMTILLVFASSMLANYFGDARLESLLILSALTVIISSLGQQLLTTAQKEMNFGPLVVLEVISVLVGFVVAVSLALLGVGVYALVWGAIANSLSSTVLAWLLISRGWRPLWHVRLEDIKPYFGFGGAVVGNAMVSQVNLTIDLLLGGRMLAVAHLGLYSVPRNFVLQLQFLVNPIVTRVGFPLIAEVQHDIPRVRAIFLRTLSMTSSINAPFYIGIAFFCTRNLYKFYLGAKWVESGDLLRVLAMWGLVRSMGNPVGSVLLGMGRAGLSLKWNLSLMCILFPVLWLGSSYGAMGLAWSLFGIQIAMFIPGWYFLVNPVCNSGVW